jgi:BirA family biotin operon repressor/biotin-[acetyl-CoA-carboxylase] ligase
MQNEPESLLAEAIKARLRTEIIGRDLLVFRETSSTNDRAREAGVAGAAQGLVFFAESQTAGRGTYGHRWISSPGQGLWLSILLRARLSVDQLPLLVQMAAVAVAEVVQNWIEEPVYIKPPNDLILAGGKLAGFLLETSNAWDFQVLGIGLNVRSAPPIPGYATAALDSFARRPIPMAELAAELLNHFEDWYLKTPWREVAPRFAHMTNHG